MTATISIGKWLGIAVSGNPPMYHKLILKDPVQFTRCSSQVHLDTSVRLTQAYVAIIVDCTYNCVKAKAMNAFTWQVRARFLVAQRSNLLIILVEIRVSSSQFGHYSIKLFAQRVRCNRYHFPIPIYETIASILLIQATQRIFSR